MTPDAYRAAITRLGFPSILSAGRWFGVTDGTARKFAEEGPSPVAAKLLEFMLAIDVSRDDVDRQIMRHRAREGDR